MTLTPDSLAALNRNYLACLSQGDWASAYAVAQQALTAMPGHPQILGDVALCQMRLGQLDAAEASYARALTAMPEEANYYDGLAELHGLRTETIARGEIAGVDATQAREAARTCGLRALALKDARHTQPVIWPLPRVAPCTGTLQVIAYTLFGANPRYGETMVLNVQAAQALFPQWVVRIYGDASVPQALRERLMAAGAQWVDCGGDDWQGIHPLMWRFAVMEDPSVSRWLLRDADSLLSTREQAAVEAWLRSGKCFHTMRDYYTHTELLLAGMMGGIGGVLHGLMDRMRAFAAAHAQEMRVVDQHFLRHEVWPTVRQSLLTHDSWFGFLNAQPFPTHAPHGLGDNFHVGCNLASAAVGTDTSNLPDGTQVHWRLLDENGAEVCTYAATVTKGAWRAQLPMPYIQRLREGQWRVV